MFIVFEWVDGCGKDTQLERSIGYIRSKNKYSQVWIAREPSRHTESGKAISEKLMSGWFESPEEALQLYVQDRIEMNDTRKAIAKHSVILSSRFDYSTYVYQGLQGIPFERIYEAHDYTRILLPDLTFFFLVNEEQITERIRKRGEAQEYFEKIDFLVQANEKYSELAGRLGQERLIVCIDANRSPDAVFDQVAAAIDRYVIPFI